MGLGLAVGLATACGDDSTPAADESSTGEADDDDDDDDDDDEGSTAVDPTTESSSGPGADSTSEGDSTSTGGDELTRIEQILADLTIGMYECPERVWPGDAAENYRSRQVLLSSVTENQGYLWNDQVAEGEPPVVTMGPLDGLPPEWSATFNIGEINGVPTLGISLDETQEINEAYEMLGMPPYRDFASILTFHEGFHFLSDQNDWNVPGGSRATAYPEPWEPRYVRAELKRSLRASLEDGAGYEAAAHWQARWLAEFPDESDAIRSYDVTEGGAEYASVVSSVLSALGCEATDDEIMAEAIANLDGAFQGTGFSPGREAYDLGVLAGLLLRRDEVVGWEDEQENGTPPVEQVLDGVMPEAQADDAALQGEVQDEVDARNIQVGMEIDPMLEALTSPEYYRVVVSFNWIAGSFGVGGFYFLADVENNPDVILTLSAMLTPPSGVAIALTGETSLVGVDTPCSLGAGPTIVLTLPVADVQVEGGLATSTADTATFDGLEVEIATDLDGLEWLCPTDAGGAEAPLPDPDEAGEAPTPHIVRLGDNRFVAVR
jgi:hypothetical protein